MSYLFAIPWHWWVIAAVVLAGLIFIPGALTFVIGIARFAKATWTVLPDRAKLAIGIAAALGALVVLHFWDVREKVAAAESRCDAKWTAKLTAEKAAYDVALAELKARQKEVVTKTVIKYRDRIKVVKEKANDVVAEIPQILPVGTSPLLYGGVRVIHDAAALGNLPDDPVGAAATAAPVETAALLTTIAENYRDCALNAERLVSLQTLVSTLGEKP